MADKCIVELMSIPHVREAIHESSYIPAAEHSMRRSSGEWGGVLPPTFFLNFYECVLKKMLTKAEKASIETGKQK